MWAAIRAGVKVYGLIALAVAAAIAVGWQFVAPPPPHSIVIAAGSQGGAYDRMARRWAAFLAAQGVRAEIVTTSGSVENLARVSATPARADIAIVQGGIGDEAEFPTLTSLGAVAREAVWVFHRGAAEDVRLRGLAGTTIAIGPEGSGTRVLAQKLIAGSGIADARLSPLTGEAAADALIGGRIDAAVFVSAEPTPPIVKLLRSPGVELLDFASRADAYVTAFPYLTTVRLSAGSVSLRDDLPAEGATLLAPVAQVVAREGIHPQIVLLLLEAFRETLQGRQFFAEGGEFPKPAPTDWALHEDAARFYRYGPGFLKRYLPFWVAVTIERTWVLLIPLLGVLIPLSRIGPPLYRWQVERKIYRWYRDVRAIEAEFSAADRQGTRHDLIARLDRVTEGVADTHVPLSYTGPLYDLREHIAFVRALLSGDPRPEAERPRPMTRLN